MFLFALILLFFLRFVLILFCIRLISTHTYTWLLFNVRFQMCGKIVSLKSVLQCTYIMFSINHGIRRLYYTCQFRRKDATFRHKTSFTEALKLRFSFLWQSSHKTFLQPACHSIITDLQHLNHFISFSATPFYNMLLAIIVVGEKTDKVGWTN